MSSFPSILYSDNHLLVLNKPCGWVTQGAAEGQRSLVDWAKEHLKRTCDKPGNVYLGVVSRLDSFTSGVVVFARTSKAAARLNDQFAARTARKIYWAIVAGAIEPPRGAWHDFLLHNDAQERVTVVTGKQSGAQAAELRYERRALTDDASWLEIELHTGRKHQIRVQAAARGHAVWGDHKYGSEVAWPAKQSIALHAVSLTLEHPTRGEQLTWTAPVPGVWESFLDVGEE